MEALPDDSLERTAFAAYGDRLLRLGGRCVGLVLSAERKVAIQEWLINEFRIPVSWQPREQLANTFEQSLEWLLETAEGPLGDYLEFGVYQGNSMICFHHVVVGMGLSEMRLFGFDSFAGLPPSAQLDGVWSPGQFRSDVDFTRQLLTEAGIDWSRTHLIEGYFDEVLDDGLAESLGLEGAAVIMIDCDLYTSTRQALEFCEPLIKERCVILFDDWEATDGDHGEKRAMAEFLMEHPQFDVIDAPVYHEQARVVRLQRRQPVE